MNTNIQSHSSDDYYPSSFSPPEESSSKWLAYQINGQLRAAWSRRGRTGGHSGHSRQDHQKRKKRKRSSRRKQVSEPVSLFLGPRFRQEVAKHLKPQSFVLFYPIPEDEDSLVVSLRLEMAYKKTDGETYFYPVIRRKIGWAVDFDKNYEQPTFDNLIELIEYYTIYRYLNVATQQMEAFPYPDVAEASESDDTVFELSLDDVQHMQ
ncbi:hypothetical protein V3C99_003976 [Haemonchus contortus]